MHAVASNLVFDTLCLRKAVRVVSSNLTQARCSLYDKCYEICIIKIGI